MATEKSAKPRRTPRKRASRAKPLNAGDVHVRSRSVAAIPAAEGLTMAEAMGRAMRAYVELPGRLLACTSPVEFWAEYLRFGQRLFDGLQRAPPEASPIAEPRAGRQSRKRPRKATSPSRAGAAKSSSRKSRKSR
jgi:hypothetical protein